jgi:hypothetical protein
MTVGMSAECLRFVLLLPLAVACGCASRSADSELPPGVKKNPAPATGPGKGSKPDWINLGQGKPGKAPGSGR